MYFRGWNIWQIMNNDLKKKFYIKIAFLIVVIGLIFSIALFALSKLSEIKNKDETSKKNSSNVTAAPTKSAANTPTAAPTVTNMPTAEATPTQSIEYLANLDLIDAGTILDENELDPDDPGKYFKSYEISDDIFERIYGDNKSYKTYCTVPREDLRYLKLLHRGFDGKVHVGELMVNKAIADELLEIFMILFQNDYQIESMYLVDDFDADDRSSIDANNTSAFNFRTITDNPDVLSYHAMGVAIDINPINNPYIWLDENGSWTYEDRDAELYLDRNASDAAIRHMINHDDLCYKLFTERGYTWGGDWDDPKDYQHFEKSVVNYSM